MMSSEHVRARIQQEQASKRLRCLIEEGLASGPAEARTASDLTELRAIARGERQDVLPILATEGPLSAHEAEAPYHRTPQSDVT